MNLLVTQQEVEERMALGSIPVASPVILSALKAAHLRAEVELDTKLDKGTNTDLFYLDASLCGGVIPDGFFRLRLKRGFVRTSPSIVVEVGESPTDTFSTISTAKLNAERGFVYVPAEFTGKYIRATYDYGFQEGDVAPDALKEAILAYTPVVFNFSANTSEKRGNAEQGYKTAGDHALAMLVPLRRVMNFALYPVY